MMLLSAMHVDIFSTLCLVISKGASPMPGVETGEKEQRNWPNTIQVVPIVRCVVVVLVFSSVSPLSSL